MNSTDNYSDGSLTRRKTMIERPFFSICVPQYNRTSFLIEACRSIGRQTCRDVEICISDDRSTDGRAAELLQCLDSLGLGYVYRLQPQNTRYDGNLRSAIELASGQYCFLLGNDDALASPTTLEELRRQIDGFGAPGVIITNYADFASGEPTRRVKQSAVVGSGPAVAVQHFRNVSFVSGVLFKADVAKQFATDAWDGSEFYQMFMSSRMIASGSELLTLDLVTVRKDIQIPGENVDSYRSKPVPHPDSILERPINVVTIGALVVDAIQPYLAGAERQRAAVRVFLQLLIFTYPFWIFEYRRVQSWKYAAGVCLSMRPSRILRGQELSLRRRLWLRAVYGAVTVIGLVTPVTWFQRLSPRLFDIAKAFGQSIQVGARA